MSAVADDSFDHQTPNAELCRHAVGYLEAGGLEKRERGEGFRLSGCGFGAGNAMRSSSSHAFGKFKSG